ncbi:MULTISPECIES: YnhF family membrane protein [unclassified Brenneria]|nr:MULTISPECIES: YnhF family membrane protein [unclassified Brenneria]MDX5627118.1 YnhF family membrane protein [Brenneria sp. L3-3Z]MDX5693532.1 YnhF family membrane protein [Brenneria sp. L4-2C]MEE3663582.1 YnhF family membrane protein [Brenneria sp. g21c3]
MDADLKISLLATVGALLLVVVFSFAAVLN